MCVPHTNTHTHARPEREVLQMSKRREHTAEQENGDIRREATNAQSRPLRSLGPKANTVRSSFRASGRGPGGGQGRRAPGSPWRRTGAVTWHSTPRQGLSEDPTHVPESTAEDAKSHV